MKCTRIFSFGPEQVLDNFTDYNLFIGPNGSGKSNVFRVLSGLDFDWTKTGKINFALQTQKSGTVNYFTEIFIPGFFELGNIVLNHSTNQTNIRSKMEINYEIFTDLHQIFPQSEQIIYEDDVDSVIRYNGGDVVSYKRNIYQVHIPEGEAEFYRDVALFLANMGFVA